MTETEALVILNAVPGLGGVTIRKLVEHFGSAAKVLSLPFREMFHAGGVSSALAQKISDFPSDTFLKSEYNLVAKYGVRVIGGTDPEYPQILREIPDAPSVLYIKGKGFLRNDPAIAVVGSRRASVYGSQIAWKFSSHLAELGLTVVSGLARGIDAAAHEGCLQAQGFTIAVMGCGLAQIYPPENARLAGRIAEGGAIVSEFPMTMPPLAFNFPRRNRIISGLTLGVVVVEASQRSGALITARFALEQGREVFAVPGQVNNPNSRGVHELIQQGARLINSPEDILEELAPQLKNFLNLEKNAGVLAAQGTTSNLEFSEDEQQIFAQLKAEPIYLDELAGQVSLPRERVLQAVLNLELKQRIRQLPGKYFVKK